MIFQQNLRDIVFAMLSPQRFIPWIWIVLLEEQSNVTLSLFAVGKSITVGISWDGV
jgi:hypothetical protein